MRGSKRRSRASSDSRGRAGCLIWLIALCVVFILVVANLERIRQTLETTGFLDIVSTQGGRRQPPPAAPAIPAPSVEPTREPPRGPSVPGDAVTVGPPPRTEPARPQERPAVQPQTPPSRTQPGAVQEQPAPLRTRTVSLYFVRIDGDGLIVRHQVRRSIPATDAPLTDAIESLLKGPGEEELRRQLLTLIPLDTRLLSAQVRGTTAYLNFSEAFMYNSYGIEGYAGQLKQVVWTATEFPTVQDVQILVEGRRREFLAGEGVYIGRPLSRISF
ncbi:MAG TPA: GerMN domain-containing protein [Magnetospirillaceae bacterium]|nr:GerMN domain-containing protein [Magnetospirillaceae bacterium]